MDIKITNLSENSDRLTAGKLQWAMGVMMEKVELAHSQGKKVSPEADKAVEIFEKFVRDSGVTLYWP
tara:strand:+ start:59 stop:259 length:201 start_codon:yes stop_codon:yes gene_type:complete